MPFDAQIRAPVSSASGRAAGNYVVKHLGFRGPSMLPGPVFTFELMTTARRTRFYLVRAFYAVILFVILWTVHAVWTSETGGELSSQQVKWFAFSAFCGIAIGQELLALALTPALVAGVVADEKQRKTLHYLLASQLTSSEIVIGKLMVRMLYLVVLLGVSLPVLSLLVLLGGIDPMLVLLACAATFSTAWFLAALSIWVSTIAKRVREAFFIAYGLEGIWLCAPLMLRNIAGTGWQGFDGTANWLAEWVGASSPVEIGWNLFFGVATGGGSASSELEAVAWMMGLQLAFGLVLALLAAVQLRPIFRRQDGEGGIRVLRGLRSMLKGRRRWRLWRRPGLADQPMLWKELYTGGPRGFARVVGFLLTLIGGGFLARYAIVFASQSIMEMWLYGNDMATFDHTEQQHRVEFYWFLRVVAPLLYVVVMLAVAGAAAAAITSEHEEDTWVSLTTTDLTGREILFAKLRGALRRGRRLGGVIILLATAGAVAGSINVLSIPALMIALIVYGWFAAVIGVWFSLQLRSTWRAQFLTIASLILINVAGQVVLNAMSRFGLAPWVWPAFTPYEISKLFFDPKVIERLADTSWPYSWRISAIDEGFAWSAIFSVLSLVGYAAFSALLTWHALRRFDVVAGRARRTKSMAAHVAHGGES
jgi:ABC-type transport system involved in multi-copper enzyme maturation permease subunit